MKNKSFPDLINITFVTLYIGSIAGAVFIDSVVLVYGFVGIGMYFAPLVLLSLLVYCFGVFGYDKDGIKRSILFSLGSILITGLSFLLLNSSLNLNMI